MTGTETIQPVDDALLMVPHGPGVTEPCAASSACSFAAQGLCWASVLALTLFAGGAMQAYANGTTDMFLVALLFLVSGLVALGVLFPGGRAEMRAFLLTYVICIFVAGLAQCYSVIVFSNPQSTVDAVKSFFPSISSQPPFVTWKDMPGLLDNGLPVLIWQQIYKLTWALGLDFGPYAGVMFNSLVMGLTASITVRTARELFGADDWRLRRVGTLFALCGLFILFGAVLIRDCFTTFLNALVLWGIVRFLVRRTPVSLLVALSLTSVSACAMALLRFEAVALFGLQWLLVFLFWYLGKGLDVTRFVATIIVLCTLPVVSRYIAGYVDLVQRVRAVRMVQYDEMSARASTDSSLGMRLVINQPLPIRSVLGIGMLMVSPIPLWSHLRSAAIDYHLIKAYHGVYQVLVLPLVFVGFSMVSRLYRKDRKSAMPLIFLAAYLLLSLAAVVVTSLEQRHMAQFMPAFIILAAIPDTKDRDTWRRLRPIAAGWFALVILLHVAWAVMKEVA
ncbi:MAG: hypothetical protein JW955_02680 [Sedimentisphaerales bacterium]|nr:hypothetical protein [Sedimentisphaerales bacterium]